MLTGCSVIGQTKHGWKWSSPSDSVTSEQIEIVANVTKETFEEVTGEKIYQEAFGYIDTITFSYFDTFCMGDDASGVGQCRGQVNFGEKKMWVTVSSSCLADTSLVHELIHMYAKAARMPNHFHENPLLFIKAKGPDEDSVEYKAKEKAREALGCRYITLF